MSSSDAPTLVDRFLAAHDLAGPDADTYAGYSKALRRRGVMLVGRLRAQLAIRLRVAAADGWTVRGWCVFAVDGSRFDALCTTANEAATGIHRDG